MPGVLMLEALTQAGAWLIRDMEDFAHSVVVLKQAKTIKYGSFVEPGRQLQLRVELIAHGERESTFKGVGTIDGQEMVKGRFTLTRYNLRERDPALARDRRVDRRGTSRPVRDAPQGFGRSAGDDPDRVRRRPPRRSWRLVPTSLALNVRTGRSRRIWSGLADLDEVARIPENQQDREPVR